MSTSPFFWILITFLCIIAQGFFSMMEMASVSFNRVRLQYYVALKIRRAIWLKKLLDRPSRLFATVILGVNIALQIGSQSSREFYSAVGLNPDFAPITQVFLVVILAELCPLFAARRYAEHVVMLGMPILYSIHILLKPIVWLISQITRVISFLMGSREEGLSSFVTRDELEKIVEIHDEEGDEFNVLASNIFSLRNKSALRVMTPLSRVHTIRSGSTVGMLKESLGPKAPSFFPVTHKTKDQIVAIAHLRDLVRLADHKQVRDSARPPWFITQDTKVTKVLTVFRNRNQHIAVVLDKQGKAVGILTLEAILEEIFGEMEEVVEQKEIRGAPVIERTFAGNTKITSFNQEFATHLPSFGAQTLAQLMFVSLGHQPEQNESVTVGRFELKAVEMSLLGIKKVSVKSVDD